MVRKKLRDKASAKKKSPLPHESIATKDVKLSRGQRKRLVNKTHVLAKKSDAVLEILKNKGMQNKKDILQLGASATQNTTNHQQIKSKKGAPTSQKKRNEMLFVEQQRFENVITNKSVQSDPFGTIQQYLMQKARKDV